MQPARIIETCLYVDDVEATATWYEDVLGLEAFARDLPRHVFLRCGDTLLLLFDPDETEVVEPGDKAAPHGARGAQHVALGVEELAPWRQRLADAGVEIIEETSWGKGDSIYFHDPAGNVVELVTRGTWPVW